MGGEVVFPARYRHVDKLFLMAQVFSKLEKTFMMVVPTKKETEHSLSSSVSQKINNVPYRSMRSSESSDSMGAGVSGAGGSSRGLGEVWSGIRLVGPDSLWTSSDDMIMMLGTETC